MKRKEKFIFNHGSVEGVFCRKTEADLALAVITNGHNGFYNYGMFPYLQERLAENNISTFSYNFSHGGVKGDEDYFTEIEKYEMNCMRLETEDLYCLIKKITSNSEYSADEKKLVLISHSLGSIPTIFGARKLLKEGIKIDGIILIAPTNTLDFWSNEEMEEWDKNGVLYLLNKRTNQQLPQGKEYLKETKLAKSDWNLENALRDVATRFLIIHGEKDEAVPLVEPETINKWNKQFGNKSELKIIPNATHTFNTKHPFTGPSTELDLMIKELVSWIKNLV